MRTLAAVDLGAQSGRVALGRFDGARLQVREVARFPNVPVQVQGRLQWDVLRLYGDVLDGLRAAVREAGALDAIGVDSWAVDVGLLDAHGRLLQNPVHYRDARRAGAVEAALAAVPPRELYERTGIQLLPINTIFELAAMAAEGDPALEAAASVLLVPDLLGLWLSGVAVTERTNATTTQCFDPRAGAWAGDVLTRLGIPERLFGEVVPPGTVLGPLTAEVAGQTGATGARVIAPATHDTASAVAAVPFREPGAAYVSAGTWSLVGVELDHPVIDDRSFAANLTNEGGVDGTVRVLRNVTGLWLLHECRRTWALEGLERSFEELVELADDAPPLRALIEPNDPRFAAPGDMPARIRAFCAETGQAAPETPAAVVRCVLESLALKHWQTVELVASVTGAAASEVHVVGGGAHNERLCQWTADAAGRPVLAGPAEATELGNLLQQAIALGELASFDEGREVVRASFPPVIYEPRDDAAWGEARERFEALASALPEHQAVGS